MTYRSGSLYCTNSIFQLFFFMLNLTFAFSNSPSCYWYLAVWICNISWSSTRPEPWRFQWFGFQNLRSGIWHFFCSLKFFPFKVRFDNRFYLLSLNWLTWYCLYILFLLIIVVRKLWIQQWFFGFLRARIYSLFLAFQTTLPIMILSLLWAWSQRHFRSFHWIILRFNRALLSWLTKSLWFLICLNFFKPLTFERFPRSILYLSYFRFYRNPLTSQRSFRIQRFQWLVAIIIWKISTKSASFTLINITYFQHLSSGDLSSLLR